MTRIVVATDLKEIKGLRVVCLGCGASFSFPLGSVPPGFAVFVETEKE